MGHKPCSVCTQQVAWTSCRACREFSCPRKTCYYPLTVVTFTKYKRGWLCSHCVEEVLYGP